ncbi:hypothetical protein NUW54_g168 [Trametes sanguinea]|uniref:Uncharacterized protein n=2 Tax=Trametes sanguinea TaxID=158606 RepID=A0ACC1Q9I9_9APHY|nr:hypothetical protein NUW54_g975 [Trametes sanguinea]KAJ3019099.1 hypothetical protein NUW54_g168 [Trametes sanguinea]
MYIQDGRDADEEAVKSSTRTTVTLANGKQMRNTPFTMEKRQKCNPVRVYGRATQMSGLDARKRGRLEVPSRGSSCLDGGDGGDTLLLELHSRADGGEDPRSSRPVRHRCI